MAVHIFILLLFSHFLQNGGFYTNGKSFGFYLGNNNDLTFSMTFRFPFTVQRTAPGNRENPITPIKKPVAANAVTGFLSVGYKKDIFELARYGFEHSQSFCGLNPTFSIIRSGVTSSQ